ncbi:MAG: peptidase S41 [Betaproteobacteria bacterium TMED156]|nr:MAG: peptidase S41 [Betaproteobacteria bacterium TMED156]
MRKFKSFSLLLVGLLGGFFVSFTLNVAADRSNSSGLPIEDLKKFASVYGAIKSNYVEDVKDAKLIKGAVSGMLSGLDPHSTYLDEDAFKDLQAGTQGEFGGLGIEVGTEDGLIKIVAPIENTPAARAGVKSGDLIIKIDDTATKGMSLSDAVKLMRGKPKTSIILTVIRDGESSPMVFNIVRDIIQVQSVRSKLINKEIGFVRISQFQEKTIQSLVTHINRVVSESKTNNSSLKGLVLDLRNDPGGLLHAAVGVSAAFLDPGLLVVSTDGKQEEAQREFYATTKDYNRTGKDPLDNLDPIARSIPMVVIVNGGSASASEIVAGALQDHKRATVLGTQSFGKGSVQTILPLGNNTAIKLTTARYYTPSGKTIQAKGIEPDFWVEETEEGDISDRLRIREADLNRHLEGNKDDKNLTDSSTDNSNKNSNSKIDKSEKNSSNRKPIEFGSDSDFQLIQAMNHLKGLTVKTSTPSSQK